ncbi:MAG: HK97 family phage prohead protease [Paracoccus sp. (in: a-proteobacteria)]|nr:HK97 family phage prohead protease [Paracoccus sp. (in: a-proteobacteria)]
MELELKFAGGGLCREGALIEGYASRFGQPDQGGDVVMAGAFTASLSRLAASGEKVRMLWQHDPASPIGVWDEIAEDAVGLRVRGRLLPQIAKAREAAALIAEGAIDGLSIGYRTIRASQGAKGLRHLNELDLWEISLVTFPMLKEARLGRKEAAEQIAIAAMLRDAAAALRG